MYVIKSCQSCPCSTRQLVGMNSAFSTTIRRTQYLAPSTWVGSVLNANPPPLFNRGVTEKETAMGKHGDRLQPLDRTASAFQLNGNRGGYTKRFPHCPELNEILPQKRSNGRLNSIQDQRVGQFASPRMEGLFSISRRYQTPFRSSSCTAQPKRGHHSWSHRPPTPIRAELRAASAPAHLLSMAVHVASVKQYRPQYRPVSNHTRGFRRKRCIRSMCAAEI
jgi:hypothetical protein